MKAGQFPVARWFSKLVGKRASQKKHGRLSDARELAAQELRQVSGGNGGSTSSPNRGW